MFFYFFAVVELYSSCTVSILVIRSIACRVGSQVGVKTYLCCVPLLYVNIVKQFDNKVKPYK